jgi:hypothetical protein
MGVGRGLRPTTGQNAPWASGKNLDEPGIAGERPEVIPLASVVSYPAVRWRGKEGVGSSRRPKEPIPSNDISWQDLLFRGKIVGALNSEKLFQSSHQKE